MAIYYVSTSGSNTNNGLSTGAPWQTIAKVNSTTFAAGDSILFKRGEVWREILVVPSNGTAVSYLTFGAYGTGSNPRILGSTKCNTWTVYSGNIWVSATTVTDPYTVGNYGSEIFFENTNGTQTWGIHQLTPALCTAEYQWSCSAGKIYVYAATNPGTRYTSVEAPQRQYCVNLNNKQYLRFDSIDLHYVSDSCMTYSQYPQILRNGLIVENLKISHISTKNSELAYGIDAGYADMTVRNCEIHNCGRRGISFHIYGSYNLTNVLVEDCYFHDGYHTTGPDFSVGSSSSYLTKISNITIRRNLFSEPLTSNAYAHQLFFQNYRWSQQDATISDVYIYSNVFLTPSAGSSAIMTEGVNSIYIYNNTFYNNNNAGSFHMWANSNCRLIALKNNIFYTTYASDADGKGTGIFIKSTQDYTKIDSNYNLYYRINNSLEIIEREYVSGYYMNGIALIRSQLGYELNSPTPANPNFVSTTDWHLQAGSPAIGRGLNLPVVATDYDGNLFANPPSIGAFEYNATSTTTVAPTTTAIPTTTLAPTTTVAPTTTIAPTTTVAPTTTLAPTTTNAPTTTTGIPPSIAPFGWHVPTLAEYTALYDALGTATEAGGTMKESGTAHWASPNTGATNTSGLTCLPAGVRNEAGTFEGQTFIALFYTTSVFSDPSLINCAGLSYDTEAGLYETVPKTYGVSLRLVKDFTTLTNGQTSVMVDIDNNYYTTICIGGKEWMTENLKVTRMNDGTQIPNVPGNTEWANLATPGYCSVSV
jgi:uncharacterized protein (TIGR02145 family)